MLTSLGDMNKPIFRHLADQKWREYKRKIVVQRLTQMSVIPDVLPSIDPTASVEIKFPRGSKVQHGQFVDSRLSQFPPVVNIQVFDKGPRLVTIVFVDSDVPNVETDDFDRRCHGIFTNIEIDPTSVPINLGTRKYSENVIVPWTPPTAQKGSPYHRVSAWVLQQANNEPLDSAKIKEWVAEVEQDARGFNMRSFVEKTGAKSVGATMFRTQWDEGMLEIMKRYNVPGADVELKRKAPERLPYKKKDSKRYR
jgi:large subunit ribosomal protein L35